MNIQRLLKPVLVSLALLVAGISGMGLVAQGAMPMSETPACVMLGHKNSMCPMSAADHLASWQDAFRAVSHRQLSVPLVPLAARTPRGRELLSGGLGGPRIRWKRRNGPPGLAPPFVRMVGEGAHQRLTYG